MADYYTTLNIDRNASQDDIKRAYRSLASKHHPDKGGDTSKFQEIQAAYATLSDPQKKAEYDNPQPQFGGFGGGNVPPGFEDVFAQMFGGGGNPFFGGGFRPQPQRNRTLNLQTEITLEDAFHGKEMIANIQLPSGKNQTLEIKIPAGVRDGTTLRLAGMGDDSIGNVPRGDIHLTVNILPHHVYQRQNDDLVRTLNVNCLDAIVGKTLTFDTLDNRTLEIVISPGTQPGQILSVNGYGMPNINDSRMKGRLLIQVQITIPTLTESQKDLIRQILS